MNSNTHSLNKDGIWVRNEEFYSTISKRQEESIPAKIRKFSEEDLPAGSSKLSSVVGKIEARFRNNEFPLYPVVLVTSIERIALVTFGKVLVTAASSGFTVGYYRSPDIIRNYFENDKDKKIEEVEMHRNTQVACLELKADSKNVGTSFIVQEFLESRIMSRCYTFVRVTSLSSLKDKYSKEFYEFITGDSFRTIKI